VCKTVISSQRNHTDSLLARKRSRLQFTDVKLGQMAMFRRLWHNIYAAETHCLPFEQSAAYD